MISVLKLIPFLFLLSALDAGWGALGELVNNKDKIIKGVDIFKKTQHAFNEIEPHQEYQVGRSFSAQLLNSYPIWDNQKALKRVKTIGQALVIHSSRPTIYADYSFILLDIDNPNGFASSGGHIFITKAMYELCQDDHQLAAVLSHEIGHVGAKHGKNMISNMRKANLGTDIALQAGMSALNKSGDETAAKLAKQFGGLAQKLFTDVVKKGFGRSQELEADGYGTLNLKAAGFRPEAMIEMLSAIEAKYGALDIPLFQSHPRPGLRIAHVKKVIKSGDPRVGLNLSSEKKDAPPKEKKKKKFGLFGR
jgi:beta-barrel assembly-enhancing protease